MTSQHKKFQYRDPESLRSEAESLGVRLPWSDDLSPLHGEVRVGDKIAPTRFAVLPVEGRDANQDGSPGERTFRRYRRYAEGGSGLIHFEAIAYTQENRASDRQLLLTPGTAPALKKLLDVTRKAAWDACGHRPLCYLQLQDSGRYSRATGAVPRRVQPVPEFDALAKVPEGTPILTDAELDETRDRFIAASVLARELGFDGVDVKACHRYLASELLGARQREGRYGGSYGNRTRLVLDMAEGVRRAIPDKSFQIISRLNLFDGIAWPYGWGVLEKDGPPVPDPAEPARLLGQLRDLGVVYVATSCGTPYGRAWINRPYDRGMPGAAPPPEHPLEGVCRGIAITAGAQKAYPDLPMAGFGYSWLRRYIPQVAAGVVGEGGAVFVGLGRELLAYPDMPRDILRKGVVDSRKVCVACGYCSEVMAAGGLAGCYIRDSECYGEIFKDYQAGKFKRYG
jgi:2,4-dienoyl-CoA reductase-like NADH-dependent reductase (Old Yellow Enzyme family)